MSNQLVEYFNNSRKDTFKQELRRAKSLQEIADIIDNELASYADIEGDYIQSLTPSEAKTALALLAMLRESNDAFGDSVVYRQEQPNKEIYPKYSSPQLVAEDTIIVTIGAGLGAGLGSFGGPIGGILGAIFGSNFAKSISDKQKQESALVNAKKHQNEIKLELNVGKLISALMNLLSKVDKLVLEKNPNPQSLIEEHKPQLSDFPEIIEFIQKLTGQRYLGLNNFLDFALHEELPPLLRMYGLQVHELSAEDISNVENLSEEIYQMYDIDRSNKFTEPFVEAPAILRESKVFLRGRIYFPDSEDK
ncbi:MAG: hypothetical protein QNJ72_20780 [Pleurocapsa sp. MO_226.B13]|nr:hypothetical protein [Pleurocapsa sp. MO_226.B13]